MSCQDVVAGSCPCVLADIDECRYCSLLQGKEVCNCDWRGYCVYEWYQADRSRVPEYPPDTLVAAVLHPSTLGLIVKMREALGALSPGARVALTLPALGGCKIAGVVLRRLPSPQLYYVATQARPAPGRLAGQAVEISLAGNAFIGHQTLDAAKDKTILVLAGQALQDPLRQLAAGLARQGNRVELPAFGEADFQKADILVIAGADSEVKQAATRLPPGFKGKVVLWPLSAAIGS